MKKEIYTVNINAKTYGILNKSLESLNNFSCALLSCKNSSVGIFALCISAAKFNAGCFFQYSSSCISSGTSGCSSCNT